MPLVRNTVLPPSSASSPGRKFIDGEPMKPATNWFFGRL
ncbi:Uncharacterised protein [Mycobacterium tuberculosis]|nr:Uncharacterised protein [Mycobacterium tuberculosis]